MGNINYVISLEGEVNTRFVGYVVPPQERPKKKQKNPEEPLWYLHVQMYVYYSIAWTGG